MASMFCLSSFHAQRPRDLPLVPSGPVVCELRDVNIDSSKSVPA